MLIICCISYKDSSFLCRMVQHPNILCMLGSVVTDTKIAIISTLVRGSNLHKLIFCSSTKVNFWFLHAAVTGKYCICHI